MTGKCNAVKNKLKKTGGRLPPSAVTGWGGGGEWGRKEAEQQTASFLYHPLRINKVHPKYQKAYFSTFSLRYVSVQTALVLSAEVWRYSSLRALRQSKDNGGKFKFFWVLRELKTDIWKPQLQLIFPETMPGVCRITQTQTLHAAKFAGIFRTITVISEICALSWVFHWFEEHTLHFFH